MRKSLTGLLATSIMLGTVVPMAFAATTTSSSSSSSSSSTKYVQVQKTVTVNGKVLSQPYAFTSLDGGVATTYVPIYYVGQALASAGFTQSYDGVHHVWNLTTKSAGSFAKISVGTGNTAISVNGQVVKKLNTLVAKDPAGGKDAQETVYMPIYYVDLILNAAGITTSWNGTAWDVTSTDGQTTASIQSITASNGVITVQLSQALATTPSVSDFSVTQSINNGTPTPIVPTSVHLDTTGRVVTLTVPEVTASGLSQTIVDGVSYQKGPAMNAVPYTVVAAVSAANSHVTSFPSTVVNGNGFTIAASVEDATGQPVTSLPTGAFTLTVGANAALTGTAVSLGNGQYEVVFTPKTLPTGTGEVATLAVAGTVIGTQNVTVSAGSASATSSRASFPDVSILNEGALYTVNITPVDANGNPTSLTGVPYVTLGTGAGAVALAASLGTPVNGAYPVTFRAPASAIATAAPLTVDVGGITYTSPSNYSVAMQTVASMNPDFSAVPATLAQNGSYTVAIALKDAAGNPVVLSSPDVFAVSYAGVHANGVVVTAGTTPGVYDVSFNAPTSASVAAGTVSKITVSYVGNGASLNAVSANGYTLGTSTATAAVSSANVSWPAGTTLAVGSPYTATVTVVNGSGNPVTGLSQANFCIQQGTFSAGMVGSGLVTSVTNGSTAGTYEVTFTPTQAGVNPGQSQVLNLGVGQSGAWTQLGENEAVMIQGSVTSAMLSPTLTNSVLLAGQMVTIPVMTSGGQTNLTASNFVMSYNGQPIPVSQASYAGAGVYDVTFMAPTGDNSSGSTLSLNVDGQVSVATGVMVEAYGSFTPALTVRAAAAGTSFTDGATTYSAPVSGEGTQLVMNSAYFLDTVQVTTNGHAVFGLPASAFSAMLSAGSVVAPLTVADVKADASVAGQYDVAVHTGGTPLSIPSAAYITVDGVTGTDSGQYEVVQGTPVSYNSSFLFPVGNLANQLIHNQSYTIQVSLSDAKGNPVVGLQTDNFALGWSTSAPAGVAGGSGVSTNGANVNGSSSGVAASGLNIPVGLSYFQVTAGLTPGQYVITFVPSSPSSTPLYLGVLVDAGANATMPATYNDGRAGTLVEVSTSATTVI